MNDSGFHVAPNDLQLNLLASYDGACCARLAFHAFSSAAEARAWVAAAHRLCFHDGAPLNVAFSYAGLRALGCGDVDLAAFPDAFREGMAARSKRLGDPPGSEALSPPGLAGSLHAVSIVYVRAAELQLRSPALLQLLRRLGAAAQAQRVDRDAQAELAGELRAELDRASAPLAPLAAHARVLGAQDLHHPLIEQHGRLLPVEYFGFRDGVNQPELHAPDGQLDADAVRQFVLDSKHPLLSKGTFMVIRQLEQDPGRFWSQLGGQRALAEQLVGRAMDGSELAGGPAGCPFHSHVRRLNPGIDPGANPRILRRGMSYSDGGTCGLMFMALNADIEAQFEFMQRNWLQRGNHVGLLSAHRDPLAGLAAPGAEPSPFAALDGSGNRTVLALESCVSLKWGQYLFVPSHAALQRLADGTSDAVASQLEHAQAPAAQQELVARWLDDAHTAGALWEHVQRAGGVAQAGDWALVQDVAAIEQLCPALKVEQYRERMAVSTGPFMLGMDPDTREYRREQPAVAIIPRDSVQLQAVATTAATAAGTFCRLAAGQLAPAPPVVELAPLLAYVLSGVSGAHFGLPGPGRGSLLIWSNDIARLHFRVAPNAADLAKGQQASQAFRAYIGQAIAAARAAIARGDRQPSAEHTLCARIDAIKGLIGQDASANDEEAARILLGIVTGSLTAVATLFKETFVVYAMQQQAEHGVIAFPPAPAAAPDADPFWLYTAVIANTAFATGRGGPDAVVRTYRGEPQRIAGAELHDGQTVVIWLGGAAKQSHDDAYLFGFDAHRCPGLAMGKAILQGLLVALAALPRLRLLPGGSLTFDAPQ